MAVINEKAFKIDKTIQPVKGSKKQVFWLKGTPRSVVKIARKDIDQEKVFKAMSQAVEGEKILDLYNVPHMRILEKDPSGPPYRYFVQEAVPKDAVCAAELITSSSLSQKDIQQMAGYINNFELGKDWQLDTNPFNWYRVKGKGGQTRMFYIDGKVYKYDPKWEFKRVGLLQWITPNYVSGLKNRTALVPTGKQYLQMAKRWSINNKRQVIWWKKALNSLLQPQ